LSIFAWITFFVCATAVALHYMATGNAQFLLFAIPGLILLIIIPMTLAWMSRRSLAEAAGHYVDSCRPFKIGRITLDTTGTAVRVSGSVDKVSFRWLNRPHFIVRDDTGTIRVMMFTTPSGKIERGDHVDVLGVVVKNIFARSTPAISAVGVEKQYDEKRQGGNNGKR